MNFIITEGKFHNKGAETMGLITIARIRETVNQLITSNLGKV